MLLPKYNIIRTLHESFYKAKCPLKVDQLKLRCVKQRQRVRSIDTTKL